MSPPDDTPLHCEACEAEDARAVTVDGVLRCSLCGAQAQGIRTCLGCGVVRLAWYDPEDPETDGEDEECFWCESEFDAYDSFAREYRHRYGDD